MDARGNKQYKCPHCGTNNTTKKNKWAEVTISRLPQDLQVTTLTYKRELKKKNNSEKSVFPNTNN